MNNLIDKMSHFFGRYPGLLPIVGLLLIILNLFLQPFQDVWLVESNLFLHLGLIVSLIGILLIKPLG